MKTKTVVVIFGAETDTGAYWALKKEIAQYEYELHRAQSCLAKYKHDLKLSNARLARYEQRAHLSPYFKRQFEAEQETNLRFKLCISIARVDVLVHEKWLAHHTLPTFEYGISVAVKRPYRRPARGAVNRRAIAEQLEVMCDIDDNLPEFEHDYESEENYILWLFDLLP